MAEMQGKTLAVPADGKIICCIGANRKNRQHSSIGRLSWYFAERGMPELIYVATINGYVASDRDKTKGGRKDV